MSRGMRGEAHEPQMPARGPAIGQFQRLQLSCKAASRTAVADLHPHLSLLERGNLDLLELERRRAAIDLCEHSFGSHTKS